jgi:nicotinamide-nucleotide adenylyltransferase|tara:strand:+ start:1099 stop:1650 length:552 start_codon:yes stop_codon:yes gene_type:complete
MARYIVLGRFQPFHFGHEHLVKSAWNCVQDGDQLVVAIGSKQAGWEPDNPWTAEERETMIQTWAEESDLTLEIVSIEDIDDPPNWVAHAEKVHGQGILVTSDEATAQLYRDAGFEVRTPEMNQRELLEGWRVRQTAKMLSTVYDDDAVREVLKASVPKPVIEWLIETDGLFRLSTFETGVHAG